MVGHSPSGHGPPPTRHVPGAGRSTTSRWVSLHAFYHGNLDVLLHDAVRPLVTDLRRRELVDGFFFQRNWEGGQHLRLSLSSTVDGVRECALDRLGSWLAEHPSEESLDLDRYPEWAATFAANEGMADHLREPVPNNTVHASAYRPETDRYGAGELLATMERHFVESSRIALGLVAAGASREQRHTVTLAALLLAWQGIAPREPKYKPDFEARYQARRNALLALAGQVAAIAAGTSALPAAGALTSWWRTVRTLPGHRVADICAHLLCNRLGLTLGDERCVRYLAARTALEIGVP